MVGCAASAGNPQLKEKTSLDLQRLSKGDRVVGISGVLLLLFSFLDWLGLQVTGPPNGPLGVPATSSLEKSAWAFPITMVAVVIGLVMTAVVIAKLFGVDLPRPGPLSWGQVFLLLGTVAFFLVALKLAIGPHQWTFGVRTYSVDNVERICRVRPNCADFTTTREVGIILGVIAAAGLLVGGYLRNQEDTAPAPTSKSRVNA